MQKFLQWFDRKRDPDQGQSEKPAKRPYKLFQIESSLNCGLACVMCPWTSLRASAGVMAWETYEKIAANFHLAEGVDLTGGGEPLQNHLLPEMARLAKEAGCEVGFSTNGVHLDRHLAEQLVRIGLDWISFSVDAADEQTYNRIRQGADFQTVLANIRGLVEIKRQLGSPKPRMLMVFVMMTGEQENYRQLPDFIRLASQLGVEHVIAKNLDVIVKDGDDARRLFSHLGPPDDLIVEIMETARQQARSLGVGLRFYEMQPREQTICEHNPVQNLFFNWEGHLSPCITLSYADSRYFDGQQVHVPCLRFGNINHQDLAEIWDCQDYRRFRQAFIDRQAWERNAVFDAILTGNKGDLEEMPAAPTGCQSCYYLYGI